MSSDTKILIGVVSGFVVLAGVGIFFYLKTKKPVIMAPPPVAAAPAATKKKRSGKGADVAISALNLLSGIAGSGLLNKNK